MAGSGGANSEPFLAVEDYAKSVGFLLGALAFIILIGLDLRNAIKKGAYWIPGRALVLSALTIQIMNFVENQSGLLVRILEGSGSLNDEIVKNNLFMIHTSRVMLCVLVAFFLPAIARPDYQEKWTKIAAIVLTVFVDIFSELISAHNRSVESTVVSRFYYSRAEGKQVRELSFFVSGAIILITLIWLILLLICAAIASKGILNISTQKVRVILAQPVNTWNGVEDHVLKSWIVASACCPESIIARSVLASSAALGVTICILSSVVGWIVQGPKVKFHHDPAFWLKFITAILEIIFILIGWAIIGWRWLTSVVYYAQERKKKNYRDYFRLEDYWTRYIVDLQKAENLKLRERKADERVSKMIAEEKKMKTILVWISLQCAVFLQCYVVFFSKLCWFFSELMLGNKPIRNLGSRIFSRQAKMFIQDYREYRKFCKTMANVLWDQSIREVILTNRKSIKQATDIMKKGNKNGKACNALIQFLRGSSGTCVGIQYPDPEKAQAQRDLKFLGRHYPVTPLPVEIYLKYANQRSWKLTAVSLINIIICLSPRCGRDSISAYTEAWELMDLVDESDPETDSLLSKAADKLFTEIRKGSWKQQRSTTTEKAAAAATINDIAGAAAAITDLAVQSKNDANNINEKIVNGKDTIEDWENLAAKIALYKLCSSIDCTSGSFEKLIEELRSSLGDIIGSCIRKVGPALVYHCRKWAEGLEKTKLLEAVYIAGKSKGLMEKLGWDPDAHIAPSMEVPQQGCHNGSNAPAAEDSAIV